MFANTYQSGYYLQVWDSRVNPEKNSLYKQLFKKSPSSIKNFYDKEVKSFIYQLNGNQRISFPFDDRQQLSLHQRYLVLQIYITIGSQWSIELGFNDINSNKKRINITTNIGKQQLKYFSFRYPLQSGALQKGIWSFLAIDIYSFMNAFNNNTVFRSLDNIVIFSACKVRRIFTMKQWSQFQIPKTFWLSSNVPQTMQLLEFKESKQQSFNLNSNSQTSKLVESKILESHPQYLKSSEKSSPLHEKNSKVVKLPQVGKSAGYKVSMKEQITPLKSSKLSEKIQLTKSQLVREYHGLIGKSNRSLTKADLIIQKSKIRLNSLQEKEEEILNKLKSGDNRFSQKVSMKEKQKLAKNENIFKSDLFKSQLSEYNDPKIRISNNSHQTKLLKVSKKFEEDSIFREESYSSSVSRQSYKDSFYLKNNQSQGLANGSRVSGVEGNGITYNPQKKISEEEQMFEQQMIVNNRNFSKNRSQLKNKKQKEEIIQEDLWTDNEEEKERRVHNQKPQTPIEEMIASQELIQQQEFYRRQYKSKNSKQQRDSFRQIANQSLHSVASSQKQSLIDQTIITKQNNKQVIIKQSMNSLNANELQLIYDQMIGCYYHPESNTYYQIKK